MENTPLKIQEKNYGFITPEVKSEDYLFGSGQIDALVLQPNGQWDDSLPVFEPQSKNFDTFNCTGFGTLNSLEILMRKKFGLEFNYSDRALGILAGTYPPGNDPNKVNEALRNNGVILETDLPFSDDIYSVEKYYSAPKDILLKGLDWLKSYVYKHDWVSSGQLVSNDIMKEALKYSPLQVGVYAWAQKDDLYVRVGGDTHWVVCYGYEDGKYFKIFDSYNNTHKKISWDFGIYWAKRISITKKLSEAEKITIYQKMISILAKIVELLHNAFPGLETLEEQAQPLPTPPVPAPTPTPQPSEAPKYMWTSPQEARHAFRVICDESGLRFQDKNLLCQVLWAESGFVTSKIGFNPNHTEDYGICQFNSYWYIEKMKLITKDQALNDPEFSVRLFIKRFKQGFLTDWSAFKNKSYLKFTP